MSVVKNEYDLVEKKNAIFVACLTDSAIYESNDKISLVGKESLNDSINKLILEKKFIEANELIRSAKDVNRYEPITAEVSSKSFRIPFEPYSKLLIISSMNSEALSDSVKKIILPKFYKSLNDLQITPGININKLNRIETLLNDWDKREVGVKYQEPYIDVSQNRSEIDDLVIKYILSGLRFDYLKFSSNISAIDLFFEEYSYLIFRKEIGFSLVPESGKLICKLSASYSDDSDGSYSFFENIEENFGTAEAEAFLNFNEYSRKVGDVFPLGEYEISFDEGKLFVNEIELIKKDLVKKVIFNELVNKYPTYSILDENSVPISYISLLPKDFEVDTYAQKLKYAISINDYEEASKISEVLKTYEIAGNLSEKIYDMLNRLIKESRVITITIPSTILYLLDLIRGKESYREFISKEIESYWKTIKSQGEIA